jgi:PAS domain S-box-containing protein
LLSCVITESATMAKSERAIEPIPANELDRLQALHSYGLLDTAPEEQFDRLTRLAASICEVPIALVSLVDKDRQWFKSKVGLETCETPRDISFCQYAIMDEQIFEVEDASKDARFAASPLVTGEPNIRFYAGQPLVLPDGFVLGALCVIDRVPRVLRDTQKESLRLLAEEAVHNIIARRTQMELRRTTTLLNDAQRMAKMGAWELDLSTGKTFWTDEVYAIHEVDTDFDHNKANGIEFYHEDDRPIIAQAIGDAISQQKPFDVQCRFITAKGNHRRVRASGYPVVAGGVVIRLMGMFQDISQEKEAQRALLESREQYQSLVQNIPGITYRCKYDADWTMLFMSSAVDPLSGYPASDFIQNEVRAFASVIHPLDRVLVADRIHTAVAAGEVWDLEYRILHRAGSIRWVNEKGRCVRGEDGEVLYLDGFILDITERKLAQAELESQRLRLAGIIEGTHVGTWEWNVQTGETVFNERWAEIVGYKLEEISPVSIETWTGFAHPEDLKESGEQLEAHFRGELDYYDFESRMLHKDGTWMWVLDRGKVVSWTPDGKPLLMLGTHQDITERKRAEEALIRTNRELEEATAHANNMAVQAEMANIAKSDFLANMSHEIRTPMNGVIGMTDLLLDTALTGEQQRYAGTIKSSGESLLALINDILDFSKIEAGKLDLEILTFDLQHLLDDVATTMQHKFEQKGLSFTCSASPDVPVPLSGDPARLRQILTNLVGNALKFTSEGEVAVTVARAECHVAGAGNGTGEMKPDHPLETPDLVTLRFSVRDTGIGIPANKIPSLFDKFTQADTSITRKYGGTGLGLAISKQLVELMGGQIGVISKPGKGAEFWFTVQVGNRTGAALAKAEPDKELGALQGFAHREARILLVEDNPVNQQVALGMLKKLGLVAETANHGHEALARLASQPYDLIFMDVQMPEMDGYEATRQIRLREGERVPIVAMTAHAMQGDREKCLGAGMDDYLVKPLSVRDLAAVLDKWLPARGTLGAPRETDLGDRSEDGGSTSGQDDVRSPTLRDVVLPAGAVIWDRSALLDRVLGDEEMVGMITDAFVADMPRQMEALKGCVASGDTDEAERRVHTIKGAAANIGGERLRGVAFALEQAFFACDVERQRQLLEDLVSAFEELRAALLSSHKR